MDAYHKGMWAEYAALQFLQENGLQLVSKNFHSRFGEIDLIMQDTDTLVFVEVRQRNSGIDAAIESISWQKQRKLLKAAQYYLLKRGRDVACRFDAIAMDDEYRVQWLKNIIIAY